MLKDKPTAEKKDNQLSVDETSSQKPKSDFEKLFDGFDVDAYWAAHPGNHELD